MIMISRCKNYLQGCFPLFTSSTKIAYMYIHKRGKQTFAPCNRKYYNLNVIQKDLEVTTVLKNEIK